MANTSCYFVSGGSPTFGTSKSTQPAVQPAIEESAQNITHIRVKDGKCTDPKCGAEGAELAGICGRLRTKK